MRIKQDYVVLTFRTTTDAMAAETRCAELRLPGRLIPLPQEIDAGCGLAWRVPAADFHAEEFGVSGIRIQGKFSIRM